MKQSDFQKIFRSSFPDPEEWQKWFFERVAVDDDEIYLAADSSGRAASALLMQPYTFRYCGSELPSAYISCVATLPEVRGRGLSSALMRDALTSARSRGYALVSLIPAEDHLYFFYSRFGFKTVYYVDEERYTSRHAFPAGAFEAVEPTFGIFHSLELRGGAGIIHSENDFRNILDDLAFESGHEAVAVTGPDGDSAMLFASYDADRPGSTVAVKALLSDSDAAADGALAELRRRVGKRPMTVSRQPRSNSRFYLRPRGMIRITDVRAVLATLAAAHPDLHTTIRVHDDIIAENNIILRLTRGKAEPTAAAPDLDVHVDTLAGILFSAPETGSIFGLPSGRPYLSMMLD